MHPLAQEHRPYNAWFQFTVPKICNLSCYYCSIGERNNVGLNNIGNKRSRKYTVRSIKKIIKDALKFDISTSLILHRQRSLSKYKMPPLDVKALLKSLGRTGRIFRVGFTGGGEPFLIPNIIEACVELSKKHYLFFNTNLTSPKVRELAERVDPERARFHASLHIKELERRNLLERFIENYHICNKHGFFIYAEEVGHPSMMKEVKSYRKLFHERGVPIQFGVFKGEYQGKTYPDSYTDEEIKCFGLNPESAKQIFRQKGKFCNAGYNVVCAGPDGLLTPCADIPEENLGHMFGKIQFQSEIKKCPVDICGCPLNEYDKHLFKLALSECGVMK